MKSWELKISGQRRLNPQVCSATVLQVAAPCSATLTAAARAQAAIAPRTSYGQARLTAVTITTETWIVVHFTPPQGTTPILPTLMVCAVSWIWNYKNLKKIFTFLPYIQLFKYYWNWKLTLRVSWLTGFGRMGIQIVSGVILMIQHCSLIQAIIVRQSLCCQTKLPVFILGTAAQWKQNKPCSATLTAAARAQQAVQIGLTTATRTWFGQALQLTAATTCLHCRMVV